MSIVTDLVSLKIAKSVFFYGLPFLFSQYFLDVKTSVMHAVIAKCILIKMVVLAPSDFKATG